MRKKRQVLITRNHGSTLTQPLRPETKLPTRAEKLISRGSEHPEVARAAVTISDLLIRLSLGQDQYFAEIVEGAVFPGLTTDEGLRLAEFFERVALRFRHLTEMLAEGDPHASVRDCATFTFPRHQRAVRLWKKNPEYFYNIHRIFCVLACTEPLCHLNQDCWETRGAFCGMDCRRLREAYEEAGQTEIPGAPR